MADLEAVLVYRPQGRAHVTLGTTRDVRALRAVRDALVRAARQEARVWEDVDEGVFADRAAEFERLCKLLAWFLPEEGLKPDLRTVPPRESETGDGDKYGDE